MRACVLSCGLLVALMTSEVAAQSSSLLHRRANERARAYGVRPDDPALQRRASFTARAPEDKTRPVTRAIEAVSMIAVPRLPPRKFKVEDLVTVIVRQQKKYEVDAQYETEKKWDITGKVNEWLRFYPNHRLGTDQLSNGQPGFDVTFDNSYETDGQNEREDKFETRIQATIIDVKPNGNLVIEAKTTEKHDDNEFDIALTGTCRSDDVTPANTIFSTQVAELRLIEENAGAIRQATQRGWIPKILDWLRPI